MVKTNKQLGDPGASLFLTSEKAVFQKGRKGGQFCGEGKIILRSKKKEEEMGGRSSGEGKLLSKKRRGILRRTENEK